MTDLAHALPSRNPGPDGAVHLDLDGAVATIVFDRPQARNAMTWTMYEALDRACDAVAHNPELRVVVLRGAGGEAFVAGTDIAQFQSFEAGADGVRYELRLGHYVAKLASLTVPTIAAVEGWAIGGGLALATVCDFRVATSGARFGVPIARTLGNCLSEGSLRLLVAALGLPTVQRMLLLAELIPAQELERAGYVLRTVAPEALGATLGELCSKLVGHAPITLSVTKAQLATLVAATESDDEARIARVYGSADFHEGVSAFVARRRPRWSGS